MFRLAFRAVFVFAGILLYASVSLSQNSSTLRLQSEGTSPSGLPRAARFGESVVWRDATSLVWQDQQGSKRLALTGQFLQHTISAQGEVIAALEKIEKDGAALRLQWHDRNGRSLGSRVLAWHEDDPLPQLCLNANGSALLLAQSASAQVMFHVVVGETPDEKKLFENAAYSNERPMFLAAGGQSFWVLSQNTPTPVNSPTLVCFSAAGEEKWRRDLPAGTPGGVAVAPNGDWILAGRYQVTSDNRVESSLHLFDGSGALRATLHGLFRQACFAENGQRLLLMDRRQLRLLSLPDAKQIWQYNLPQHNDMFVGIASDVKGENHFALAAVSNFKNGRFVFEQARLIRFNASGRQQSSTAIKTDLIEPVIALSPDGRRLTLAADRVMQTYQTTTAAKIQEKGTRSDF